MHRFVGLAALAFFLPYFQTVNSSEKCSKTAENGTASSKEKQLYLNQNQDRLQKMDSAPNSSKPKNIQNVWRPLIKCRLEKSCSGRCTWKREFHQPKEEKAKCYCDPFCDSVFHDCCADYDKECNATAKKENFTKTELDDLWTCTKVDNNRLSIWTIANCKSTWKDEKIAKKCTSPNKLQISTQIPVIDNNNFTFRNRYCALCNGIHTYEPWIFKVRCNAVPASVYTEAESWEFTDSFCESKLLDRKFSTRGIRYCYDVIKECKKDAIHSQHIKNCEEQPTGIVAGWDNFKNYKNMDCLFCNCGNSAFPTCGPKLPKGTHTFVVPRPYSAIFTSSTENRFISYSRCPASHIYDSRLGDCRKLLDAKIKKSSQQQLQKFAIILRYDGTENGSYNTITKDVQTRFNYVFEKLLKVSLIETNLEYSDLDIQKQKNSSFFVTFHILGLKQDLEDSEDTPFDYSKIENLTFHASFDEDMKHGVSQYSLTKSVTREMICVQNTTFVAVHRTILFSNGTIFINQTQNYYNEGEFLTYNETFFVVCKEYKPTNCSYYNVLQKTNDWILFPNRSIYSHVTKSVFDFGEYSILDSKAWVCLKDTLVLKTNRIRVSSRSIHKTILSYATLISLTVSILSLITLIITYSMSCSLRNLPGKNLMLLCGTLALAQMLWLIEGNISSSSVLCHMTAIGSHFAFLSSFCASGSIAIHSYLTFRRLAKGNLSLSSTRRHFLWYSAYSIALPFVWVALWWTLDSYQIISLRNEFSNSCWFDNSQGLKFAFVYPAAAQLFFNITLLFATLRLIHKCSKASLELQEKNGATNRRCVGVYFRMSTLMGLSWLFGVFVVTFPHLVVFEYMFVFGNGFQGLYIALAFLLTKNVKKLMAKRFTTSTRSASQSSP